MKVPPAVVITLLGVVTLAWLANIILRVALPAYEPYPAIDAAFMLVATAVLGFVFKPPRNGSTVPSGKAGGDGQ